MVPLCRGRQTLGQLLLSAIAFLFATDLPTRAAGMHRTGANANQAKETGGLKTGAAKHEGSASAGTVKAEAGMQATAEASAGTAVEGMAEANAEATLGTEAASASGIIPEWRLKETDGLPVLRPEPDIYSFKLPQLKISSTPAQDMQKCPLLKIPENVSMVARSKSWWRLTGDMDTKEGLTLATWSQNLFTYDWHKVDIFNKADGSRAVRARILTNEEMELVFAWKEPRPQNTGNHSTNETNTASSLLPSFHSPLKQSANIALLDCDGRLTYVVTQAQDFPHQLKVYNYQKKLLADSIVDTTIMRYQFIDPESGYLIATAEAPDVGYLIDRSKLPKDPALGMVPPFGIRFEKGGYTNSSRLMDTEYRWVITTAVQVAAINLAEQKWSPREAQAVLDSLWVLFFILVTVGSCYMAYYIYCTIFPPEMVHAERKMLYKGKVNEVENPFLKVPSVSSYRPALTSAPFQSPGYVDYRTMYEPTGLHGN